MAHELGPLDTLFMAKPECEHLREKKTLRFSLMGPIRANGIAIPTLSLGFVFCVHRLESRCSAR